MKRSEFTLAAVCAWFCVAGTASAQVLAGQGKLKDEPGNEIHYRVDDLLDASGKPDRTRTVFVLAIPGNITWWKSLDLFSVGQNGDIVRVFRIEVHDDKKTAEVTVFAPQMQGAKQLECWKGGFLGIGHMTYKTPLDGTAMLGKRVTITYVRD